MIEQVRIEKMVSDGHGLARSSEGVIFVENACTEDLLEVEIISTKRGTKFAKITKIIEASKYRREPPCAYVSECGGCDWQYINYDHQIDAKLSIIKDSFKRIAKFNEDINIDIFKSPEWQYRSRVQIQFNDKGDLGFKAKRSHDVVNIKECKTLVPALNRLFETKDKKLFKNPKEKTLMAIAGTDHSICSEPKLEHTQTSTEVKINDFIFELKGKDFIQNNTFLISKLADWVVGNVHTDNFVDLYGGTGFFSVFLSKKCKNGVLVESMVEQVKRANENFSRNKIKNVTAYHSQAKNWFSKNQKILTTLGTIIIDPPRTGLDKDTLAVLGKSKVKNIIYISCNPGTLSRDLKELLNYGYNIEKCSMFDLYPQTKHVEVGVVLKR